MGEEAFVCSVGKREEGHEWPARALAIAASRGPCFMRCLARLGGLRSYATARRAKWLAHVLATSLARIGPGAERPAALFVRTTEAFHSS